MHRCENSTYYLLDLETSLDYRVLIHCVTLLIYMLNDTFACSIIFHISKCILDLGGVCFFGFLLNAISF